MSAQVCGRQEHYNNTGDWQFISSIFYHRNPQMRYLQYVLKTVTETSIWLGKKVDN